MQLTRLELSGFKSFGTKTTLEFPASIIQVVGPNGSGKSNIAEAMRFVLGEQSIKSLRGKKGEDLIFNGSPMRPRSNRASVKIVFDNKKRFLDIDFDEVSIERVVHRDGTNKYNINGSNVRLKDVMELLVGGNIGATGHHIISQGEADKMLGVNPLERKSIIEDSLGLKKYHYRIRESERKLDKTEQNMSEVKSRRQELTPHVQYLRRQVDKIEKARAIREDLKEKYREYLKREELYVQKTSELINVRLEELQKDRDITTKELEDARGQAVVGKTIDTYSDDIREVRKDVETKRGERDNLLRKLGAVEGEISSYRRIIEQKPKVEIHDRPETILFLEVEKVVADVRRRIQDVLNSDDIHLLKTTLEEIRVSFDTLVKNPTTVPDQFEEARAQAEVALEELIEKKSELDVFVQNVQNEEKKLVDRIQELEDSWHKDQTKNEEDKRRVLELTHVVEKLDSQIERERERRQMIERENVRFEEELTEAGVLVGAYVLKYKEFEVEGKDGSSLTEEEIVNEDRQKQENRRREIEKLKIRLEDMQISGGDDVIKEYQDIVERDAFLEKELKDLEESGKKLRALIEELHTTLEREFDEGMKVINKTFQEFFVLMFGGGEASLEQVKIIKRPPTGVDFEDEIDEEDVVEEKGVDVKVKIPKKNVKSLQMLSGGERTLTSLAMLFAMSQVNPPPFIILDETDAALDEANSKRYGEMIVNLSKHSQLIIITHNRETMAHSDVLYGVTMTKEGVSKILSIKFEEAQNAVEK